MAKEVKLTRGKIALVDDVDWSLVAPYRWRARPITRSQQSWYALTTIGGRTVYMHRFLMQAKAGSKVDHANRNGLDNRRSANLRFCSSSQNQANRQHAPSKVGYRGVGDHPDQKRKKRYRARVQINGNRILGRWHDDPILAAREYDALAIAAFGSFAILNFPMEGAAS